jgi:hypothetical protein
LGREAFQHPGRTLPVAVAVGAFIVSTAASIYVVLPRSALVSALGGSTVYEQFHVQEMDIEEVHRRLADDLDTCDTNDRQIDGLVRGFASLGRACRGTGRVGGGSRPYNHMSAAIVTPRRGELADEWSQPGSNRRPPACKAGALPTELWPRRSQMVGRLAGWVFRRLPILDTGNPRRHE